MKRFYPTDEEAARALRAALGELHIAIDRARHDGLTVVIDDEFHEKLGRSGTGAAYVQQLISVTRKL